MPPTLTVGGVRPAPPLRASLPLERALPLADLAWTLARIDAWDIEELLPEAQALRSRIQRGEGWLARNPGHPDHDANGSRVYRLSHRLDDVLLRLRCLERACWLRCEETQQIIANAKHAGGMVEIQIIGERVAWGDDRALTLWQLLLGDYPPPEIAAVGGLPVVPFREPLAGIGLWELDDLHKALARRNAQRERTPA